MQPCKSNILVGENPTCGVASALRTESAEYVNSFRVRLKMFLRAFVLVCNYHPQIALRTPSLGVSRAIFNVSWISTVPKSKRYDQLPRNQTNISSKYLPVDHQPSPNGRRLMTTKWKG